MKPMPSKSQQLFAICFISLFFMSSGIESIAQCKNISELKTFKITIEKTDNGLKLQSHHGSAWKDLQFQTNEDNPQAIDEYGMTQIDKVNPDKAPEFADYLFTITKTRGGIKLTGIEGTAWKELFFTLRKEEKQSIDALGMTE